MFKNILVPVDFGINTRMAVTKAIELSDPSGTFLHLFHVDRSMFRRAQAGQRIGGDREISGPGITGKNVQDLARWKESIESDYPYISVMPEVEHAMRVQDSIIKQAGNIQADIIIIGKHSGYKWPAFLNTVFPDEIAKHAGCPVLTLKSGALNTALKSIVVPVGPSISQRKVDLIIALKQKFRITIHLVMVINKNQTDNTVTMHSLLGTYRFLKEIVQCPIVHQVLQGENIARSAFNYAKDVKADLLLVESGPETLLSAFPKKHINDTLKPGSRLQILAVQSSY